MIKRLLTGGIRLLACAVALQGTLGCCGLFKMFENPASLSSSSYLDVLPLAMLVAWGRRICTHHFCLCCWVLQLWLISSITFICNTIMQLAAPVGNGPFYLLFLFLSGLASAQSSCTLGDGWVHGALWLLVPAHRLETAQLPAWSQSLASWGLPGGMIRSEGSWEARLKHSILLV